MTHNIARHAPIKPCGLTIYTYIYDQCLHLRPMFTFTTGCRITSYISREFRLEIHFSWLGLLWTSQRNVLLHVVYEFKNIISGLESFWNWFCNSVAECESSQRPLSPLLFLLLPGLEPEPELEVENSQHEFHGPPLGELGGCCPASSTWRWEIIVLEPEAGLSSQNGKWDV